MRSTTTGAVPRGTSLVAAPRRAAAAAPARRLLRAPILPSRLTTKSTPSTSSTPSNSFALRLLLPAAAASSGGGENGRTSRSRRVVPSASASSSSSSGAAGDANNEGGKKPSLAARLKALFGGGDKLDRERLKALGTGAVASYGAVSNVTYGGGMAVSWVGFVKKFGTSPLAAGQWPKFLAFYSAFWMAQNFVRPLRFSLALAMAPAFDRFIDFLASKLGISRPKAFGVYLAILGITTSTLVFGGIFLACGPAAYAR